MFFFCFLQCGGWEEDLKTGALRPKMLPDGVDIAPEEVLRVIKCNCKGEIDFLFSIYSLYVAVVGEYNACNH